MRKLLPVIILSLTPLTGCSSSEPSYDPVELIEYEKCLNTVPIQYDEEIWSIEGFAEQHCESKKPILK